MHTRSIIAILVLVTALGIFTVTGLRAVVYAPDTEISVAGGSAPPSAPVTIPPSEFPIRLRVPSIGINAAVQQVGINTKGNMSAPSNYSDVGWYKYGTLPGNMGSAVIDGHVDNGLGFAGVFKRLRDVKVGDDIYVETSGGRELHFVVSSIETYPYLEVPLETLFTRSDLPRLNLITCDGVWLPTGKTYDKRLVVYTTLAESF